jgi:hypothetical protein
MGDGPGRVLSQRREVALLGITRNDLVGFKR